MRYPDWKSGCQTTMRTKMVHGTQQDNLPSLHAFATTICPSVILYTAVSSCSCNVEGFYVTKCHGRVFYIIPIPSSHVSSLQGRNNALQSGNREFGQDIHISLIIRGNKCQFFLSCLFTTSLLFSLDTFWFLGFILAVKKIFFYILVFKISAPKQQIYTK